MCREANYTVQLLTNDDPIMENLELKLRNITQFTSNSLASAYETCGLSVDGIVISYHGLYSVFSTLLEFFESFSENLISKALFFNKMGQNLYAYEVSSPDFWNVVGQFVYVITYFTKTEILMAP